MGVNICVYRLGEKDEYGDYNTEELTQEEWDFIRYVGDKDYAVAGKELGHEMKYRNDNNPIDGVYERPTDFNKDRYWVKNHISECGQKRYLDLFDKMEKDPSMYFYFSW
jgi:hypothetical protein